MYMHCVVTFIQINDILCSYKSYTKYIIIKGICMIHQYMLYYNTSTYLK